MDLDLEFVEQKGRRSKKLSFDDSVTSTTAAFKAARIKNKGRSFIDLCDQDEETPYKISKGNRLYRKS